MLSIQYVFAFHTRYYIYDNRMSKVRKYEAPVFT